MCSIYGAFGRGYDTAVLEKIRERARDRGRDGGRMETYSLRDGYVATLGNWRAAPTPELMHGELQPYDGVVHNGTIANDVDLGRVDGEIDSQVLPRVLDRTSLEAFAASLGMIKGSYAIAAVSTSTLYLVCNYKPLYLWSPNGSTVYFSSMARHFADVCEYCQAPKKMPPYTAFDMRTGNSINLLPAPQKRAVVVCSGGLDSTVVATRLVRDGYDVCLVHFLYGCKAQQREVERVAQIATYLKCQCVFLDVPYGKMQAACPLFGDGDRIADRVAGAEYAHEWVPARNLVFLSLALAWAEANDYHAVAFGANQEEACGGYTDNEEELTYLLDQATANIVQCGYSMRVLSPVGHLVKHEIVKLGLEIDAPMHLTWSCYRGGETHCGQCGPCFMRREAFVRDGRADPVFAHEKTQANKPGPVVTKPITPSAV